MKALRLSCNDEHGKAYGEILNLSNGTFTTWQHLAELLRDRTDSSSELELVPRKEWQGDVSVGTDRGIPYICNLDISKVERLTGYRPNYRPREIESLLRGAVSRLVLARKES